MQKILIVEDDDSLRHMYRFKLEVAGYKVDEAENGEVGLSKAHDFEPSLILLDLMMPVMNGDEMLQKLREKDWGKNIRVIILTNLNRREAPMILAVLSVSRYVVKVHTTPAEVVRIIQDVLSS